MNHSDPLPSPQPATEPGINPSPLTSSSLPKSRQRLGRKGRISVFIGAVVLFLSATVGYAYLTRAVAEPFSGPTWKVKREKLVVTVVEKGTLESAENSEIVCRVKAKTSGGPASTIKWVIDDGTEVRRGDLLMLLDDGPQQDLLTTQTIEVDKANSDLVTAQEELEITRSQNFSDIEKAKIDVITKEITLRKYLGNSVADKILRLKMDERQLRAYLIRLGESDEDKELLGGEYLLAYNDFDAKIETARSDRDQWLDRASWSQRMAKKGYVSRSQAEADEAKRMSSEFTLRKSKGDLQILRQFTLQEETMKKWSDYKEAERIYERAKIQAKAKEKQKEADLKAKQSIYYQQLTKKWEIEEEIAKCRILAPQDGMVVHVAPDTNRFGNSQTGLIAQGETVKEGQKLIRIPDLRHMQVKVNVHEAMVSLLKGEIEKPTGFTSIMRAGLLADPNGLSRLVSQLTFYEVRPRFRQEDFDIVYAGQPASVRVDAFPSKVLQGHVRTVATVASKTDWLSADVRVFPTTISIDDKVENLRPDFSAEVTITADETAEPVLSIPIQCVVGNISMGEKRKCFVLDADGIPHERDIVVGKSNVKMVEVLEGLKEREEVVLNPRPLLGEKSDMKPARAGTRGGEGTKGASGGGEGNRPGPGGGKGKGGPGGGSMKAWPQKQGKGGGYSGGRP
jgi:HlyD family secretion protein